MITRSHGELAIRRPRKGIETGREERHLHRIEHIEQMQESSLAALKLSFHSLQVSMITLME